MSGSSASTKCYQVTGYTKHDRVVKADTDAMLFLYCMDNCSYTKQGASACRKSSTLGQGWNLHDAARARTAEGHRRHLGSVARLLPVYMKDTDKRKTCDVF